MSAFARKLPANRLKSILSHPKVVKLLAFKPVKFFVSVLDDYKSVGKDTISDGKARPFRTAVILASLSVAYAAFQRNPTGRSFTDLLLESNNDLIQVPPRSRNIESESFLVDVHRYRSADRLKHVNLGLFSLILHEDFNKSCDVYEAHCKYLVPSLFTFYDRLVDVGIFNRWIRMERAMKDFDVNYLD